ncbi:hypothetical protein [Nitrosopumilus ureiphilus]|uniref:Uncharacterized protein n=1 Tax=Nitrosopumilus ureiphilus TaxID=1470067 RepID=A0A7D5M7T3_9ARCH|nr:hypothetical protein [Nitrosopumilus ureiphilus]QLH06590.1 hypothetical protein C5F50_05535 [Nitrosopumilus ureiphilus]
MTKKDHIVIHSIKHHLPAGGIGATIGIYWVVDSAKEGLSAITNDSEIIQGCIEIAQSVLPF